MIDPQRIAVAGHSDGALISFSDGFVAWRNDWRVPRGDLVRRATRRAGHHVSAERSRVPALRERPGRLQRPRRHGRVGPRQPRAAQLDGRALERRPLRPVHRPVRSPLRLRGAGDGRLPRPGAQGRVEPLALPRRRDASRTWRRSCSVGEHRRRGTAHRIGGWSHGCSHSRLGARAADGRRRRRSRSRRSSCRRSGKPGSACRSSSPTTSSGRITW